MRIILSTRNRTKIEQTREALAGLDITILTLDEAGIRGEAAQSGSSLAENASQKARFAWARCGGWTVADDTGLYIEALNGKPGIYADRWAGNEATTEEIMHFTLANLGHVPLGERVATFRTMASVISPVGVEVIFRGHVSGIILLEPRVPCQPEMPYSAIFKPDGSEKVWAEMSLSEENAISHRGKAFRQVREHLAGVLA